MAVTGAVAFEVGFLTWLVTDLGGPRVTHAFDDIAGTLAPFAAATACLVTASRLNGRARRGWALLGIAALCWGAGEAIWTTYELAFDREVPFPSFADVGYLSFIPLAVAGMLTIPAAPKRMASRLRTLLDGLLIMGSLLFLSWALVLGPTYQAGEGSAFEQAVALSYPLGDVVIAFIALFVGSRLPRGTRLPLILLTFGLGALAGADSGFAYLELHGGYTAGSVIGTAVDAAWVGAFLLVGLAAMSRLGAPAGETPPARATWFGALLPYAALPLCIVIVTLKAISGEYLGLFLAWNGIAVMLLLVGRQFVTVRENVSLAVDLEATVTERTSELRASEEQSRLILETANDAFVSMTADGQIVDWNRRAETTFGWSRDEAVGRSVEELLGAAVRRVNEGRAFDRVLRAGRAGCAGRRFEITALHRYGTSFPAEITLWSVGEPGTLRINAFVRDISERKAFEAQLTHQALHDSLTGLANRALFEDRVRHALAKRDGDGLALLFLDLDNFKTVNDSLGHGAGDALLARIACVLRNTVRPGDTIARLGGDEFAILLEKTGDTRGVVTLAERVMASLQSPIEVQDREITVRASMGISIAPPDGRAEELLRNADLAMYAAKARGKGRFEIFEPGMHAAVLQRLELEADLREAIERHSFDVVYQPVVELITGRIQGVEALARWTHPRRGPIPPHEFIPLAEDTGLITPLGEWLLERACTQAHEWQTERTSAGLLRVNVNLSVRQFQDATLVDKVTGALERSRLDPASLVLEITESVMMDDPCSVVETLGQLRRLGIHIAIDDFGTGYSSLGYLRRLPIDMLKIDKSFVDGITEGPEESALARSIIKLGDTLQLSVTAEGIEAPEQARLLRSLGCDFGQGYLFAPPLPAGRVGQLIAGIEVAHGDRRPARCVGAPVEAMAFSRSVRPGARDARRAGTRPRPIATA